ncbi:hypothetical protein OsI_02863 [Oryza sativa Indica Group]|uniref:Uncharacterized protein n=1 Tax=Oryza sativa subsp. indica TaxID=39946 RepID=A2WSM0_ORYSI|nr:hypothetical protein OsI_02863 [Oryza sativa Indica Group]
MPPPEQAAGVPCGCEEGGGRASAGLATDSGIGSGGEGRSDGGGSVGSSDPRGGGGLRVQAEYLLGCGGSGLIASARISARRRQIKRRKISSAVEAWESERQRRILTTAAEA